MLVFPYPMIIQNQFVFHSLYRYFVVWVVSVGFPKLCNLYKIYPRIYWNQFGPVLSWLVASVHMNSCICGHVHVCFIGSTCHNDIQLFRIFGIAIVPPPIHGFVQYTDPRGFRSLDLYCFKLHTFERLQQLHCYDKRATKGIQQDMQEMCCTIPLRESVLSNRQCKSKVQRTGIH